VPSYVLLNNSRTQVTSLCNLVDLNTPFGAHIHALAVIVCSYFTLNALLFVKTGENKILNLSPFRLIA
jgi:hypothetical protein